jgi:RNA polymerase sigma-70 factor (ECF subfamily)
MSSETALPFPNALVEADTGELRLPAAERASASTSKEAGQPFSDEELLWSVGQGCKQALGDLFQRHGRAVFHVAWRILRDEGEADDLRQEVFLYLHQKANHYDPEKASASSWIIQIAYHRAIDRRRYLSSRQHYKSEELDEQGIGALFTQPLTDQIDGKTILGKLRSQLSPEQQQTLELHFFEGYTLREIAEQSGQNIGKVRHHYYRALDRLRSNLFSKKRG